MKEVNVTCDSCGAKDNQHNSIRAAGSKDVRIKSFLMSVEFEDTEGDMRTLGDRTLHVEVDLCDECFDKRWEELKKFGR